MDKHLLTEIEIKDFKCFKDFKADGFKRVNLIGGKNNVGKTALMEACFVNVRAQNIKSFTQSLCNIKLMRETLNIFENLVYKKEKLKIMSDMKYSLELMDKMFTKSNINKTFFNIKDEDGIKEYIFQFNQKNIIINIKNFSFEMSKIKNIQFINNYGLPNNHVINSYSYMQKIDKEDLLNIILKEFDERIEAFKIIDEKAQCKVNGSYYEITELGDGAGNLVSIISSLFQCKDGYIFIDEIENGFHYSFLHKLWEIILTISKEQNVQVFATTHSKECIESYARVSKKLEDEDVTYIKMSKQKDGLIYAGVREYDILENSISQDHEIR